MKIFNKLFNKKTTEDNSSVEEKYEPNGFKLKHYVSFNSIDHEIFFDGKSLFNFSKLDHIGLNIYSIIKTDTVEYNRYYTDNGFVELSKVLGNDKFNTSVTLYKQIYQSILTDIQDISDIMLEFGDSKEMQIDDFIFHRIIDIDGVLDIPKIEEKLIGSDGSEFIRDIYSFPYYHDIDDNHSEIMIIDIIFENGYYTKKVYVGVEFEQDKYEII